MSGGIRGNNKEGTKFPRSAYFNNKMSPLSQWLPQIAQRQRPDFIVPKKFKTISHDRV